MANKTEILTNHSHAPLHHHSSLPLHSCNLLLDCNFEGKMDMHHAICTYVLHNEAIKLINNNNNKKMGLKIYFLWFCSMYKISIMCKSNSSRKMAITQNSKVLVANKFQKSKSPSPQPPPVPTSCIIF